MKRRISFIVIGLAIVLIPTFIMLSFYLSNRNIPVEIRNPKEVIMLTPDGKTVKSNASTEDNELAQLLCDMTLDAKSVEKLPQEAEACKLFQVTFRTDDSSLVYRFYFGENPAYCYFVTEGGSVWRIATEKAQLFLNGEHSEPIYSYAKAPTVTLNGNVMTAVTLDWEYRLLNGTYRMGSCSVKEQEVEPIDLGMLREALKIDSTQPADSIIVNAHDEKGVLLYTGDGSGFENISVTEDTEIILTLVLEWKKDAAGQAPFAGKAVYTAKTRKSPPPSFSISHSAILPGQSFVIRGNHISDPSKVKIHIEPASDFQLKLVGEGRQVKALMTLGFPEEPTIDHKYRITVTDEETATSKDFDLTLKGGEYGSFRDYVSSQTLGDTFTLSCKEEFWECMQQIMAQPSTYSAKDGKLTFIDAVVAPDASRSYAYGSQVIIHATKAEYRALDTMYCAYSASKPVAVADGKVLFVGQTALSGQMIVIDHGQGIRSWYCNLGETAVNAGQSVKQGDVIGKCLGGGFNGQGGLNMHVALTLENTALDLKMAIQNGIEY